MKKKIIAITALILCVAFIAYDFWWVYKTNEVFRCLVGIIASISRSLIPTALLVLSLIGIKKSIDVLFFDKNTK